MEDLAAERAEVLALTGGVRAFDPGHAFYVVAADFESVDHAGDSLQTERTVLLGVAGVVGIGESMEMVVEDVSQDIRPPRDIGGGVCGRDCGVR